LISKGKVEKARAILVKYHAAGNADSPLVEYEMHHIKQSIEQELEMEGMGWSSVSQPIIYIKRPAADKVV
jgi:hypothetical protein